MFEPQSGRNIGRAESSSREEVGDGSCGTRWERVRRPGKSETSVRKVEIASSAGICRPLCLGTGAQSSCSDFEVSRERA